MKINKEEIPVIMEAPGAAVAFNDYNKAVISI